MKMLIAENDLNSRILLLDWLDPFGLVHTAINGQDAFDSFILCLLTREPYHLLCLDVTMPIADGSKLVSAIRRYELFAGVPAARRIKIVGTTSPGDDELVDGFLVKPLKREDLLAQLQRLQLIFTVPPDP